MILNAPHDAKKYCGKNTFSFSHRVHHSEKRNAIDGFYQLGKRTNSTSQEDSGTLSLDAHCTVFYMKCMVILVR